MHKWCKLIENRLAPTQSPLRQFCKENFQGYNAFKLRKEHREGFLSKNLVERVERAQLAITDLLEQDAQELAICLDSRPTITREIKNYAQSLPYIEVDYTIKPIA